MNKGAEKGKPLRCSVNMCKLICQEHSSCRIKGTGLGIQHGGGSRRMCVGLPMKRNLGVLHLFPPIIYTEQTRKSKNRYIHPRGSCYRSERGRLWLFTEETKCFLLFFFSFFFFSAKTESKLEKGVKQRRVNKREYWGIKAVPEGRGMWISKGAKEHEKKRPRISTKLHNI